MMMSHSGDTCSNFIKKWSNRHDHTNILVGIGRCANGKIEKLPNCVDLRPHIGYMTLKQNQINIIESKANGSNQDDQHSLKAVALEHCNDLYAAVRLMPEPRSP
jgi:hypothetical protein